MRFAVVLAIALACNCGALDDVKSADQHIVFQNKDEHIFEVRTSTSTRSTPEATTQGDISSTSSQGQQSTSAESRPSTMASTTEPYLDKRNQTADRLGNEDQKMNCNCIRIDQCPLVGTRIVTPENICPEKNTVRCCIRPSQPHRDPSVTCGFRSKNITMPDEPPLSGQAPYGFYPWVVAILDADTNEFLGGGVLLNNVHVLTAAHKIYTVDSSHPERIKVRLGEWDARQHREPYKPIERNLTEIIIHPEFNAKNLKGDIAILTMEEAVPLRHSPHIGSACLPAATSNFVGQRCWVSGWGKDAFEPLGKLQEVMKHVDVPVIDSTECEMRLRDTKLSQHFQLDKQSFLCAGGEPEKDACTGDGGSPLVCESTATQGQFYVAGLVAWGIGCATSGLPGVYVNVAGYADWIKEVTANFRNLEY